MEDFSKFQDVLGQLAMLKTYTHILLGFPLQNDTLETRDVIVKELKRAASQLTATFPWLAGHVVHEGVGPGSTGLAKIVPYKAGERPTQVTVKDCTRLVPSFNEIMRAGGPMSMLDGNILSTRRGLPESYDVSQGPAPVIAIQANFVDGGLLLAFASQHNIMDMNGQGKMIGYFSKALRREPLTKLEIEHGNCDRREVVRLLSPEEMLDVSQFRVKPSQPSLGETSEANTVVKPAKWVYFHFPGGKLAELKTAASVPPQSASSWISTDDVLSAFVCQHVLAARIKRLGPPPGGSAVFCRAINSRRYLETPLPPEYLGQNVFCVSTLLPTGPKGVEEDLSTFARRLRAELLALDPKLLHSFATAVAAEADKSQVTFAPDLAMDRHDLMYSSWSYLGLYRMDFGPVIGGKPRFAKRQEFVPMEGLAYGMPKSENGDVDVAICLKDDDVQTLRADEDFMAYAQYIG